MFINNKDKLFCEVASDMGILTSDQVDRALAIQVVDQAIGINKPIGEYLFDAGVFTKEQIAQILKIQNKYKSSEQSEAKSGMIPDKQMPINQQATTNGNPPDSVQQTTEPATQNSGCFGCFGCSSLILVIVFLFSSFLSEGAPMPLTLGNIKTLNLEESGARLMMRNQKEIEQFVLLNKLLIEPVVNLGYSFDATIAEGLRKFNENDGTSEEVACISILAIFTKPHIDDLERGQFITPTTAKALRQIAGRVK